MNIPINAGGVYFNDSLRIKSTLGFIISALALKAVCFSLE
jgi:hypothetical protein